VKTPPTIDCEFARISVRNPRAKKFGGLAFFAACKTDSNAHTISRPISPNHPHSFPPDVHTPTRHHFPFRTVIHILHQNVDISINLLKLNGPSSWTLRG
jgi:hypothetical protein